ncbi:MAG TPA: NAD-dependent deacylase [Pyrinomonadaceae bacterium]|jgi:NAD-dependent deacetylase|nr:NAD-dependent deacylase [Pyrinomonadaceae bacterium]
MPTQLEPELLTELRERLRKARRVFVLTGAGVSAESGVPTFRGGGQTSVWKGMPFEVISSAGMLARDLPAVSEWFDYRRDLLRDLRPNPAHRTLAGWQDKFERFRLATQNIDGLHHAAGSREVLELHGNIWRARCTECGERASLLDERGERERPPACPACANAMRPDVVLFGEMLPAGVFERAAEDAARCDLCFVVGTSSLVYPAMRLPEIAHDAGAYIIEINPEQTPFSAFCDVTIQGRAGEVLPQLEH